MFIAELKTAGPQEYIYEELQYKSVIDFANLSHGDALATATSLARKMHFMKDEGDIRDILKRAYIYEGMDKEDINRRLELMTPDNMYVIHHSPSHKIEKEEHPQRFQVEKWFQREFAVQELTEAELKELASA